MSGEVRVLLYHEAEEPRPIEAAYHESSARLTGVPGLLGNELLRSISDPSGFVVVSSWSDITAFQEWERGTEHRGQTAPLRPFRDKRLSRPFDIYQVRAAY